MEIEKMPNSASASAIEQKQAERLANTKKILDGFINLKSDERVLFILDDKPFNTDQDFINLFRKELDGRGIKYDEFLADDKKTKQNELFNAIKGFNMIWCSWGMEETKINFDKFTELINKLGSRMAFCPGVRVENLDNDGALSEDRQEMEQRLNKMETRLKDVAGFQITSVYGTKLQIKMKPGERKWFKDSGVIQEGSWDNLPGGEIFTTPDEENIDGVLMLPVLQDEVTREQGVDEFVKLTIRGGKIAKIDGGESAEKLRRYLESNSKLEKDPLSVLQCSEIAFGANSKARSAVSNPDGHYSDIGRSTVETEKRLGTMHLAFGDSRHGVEGTEGYNESEVHLDFVLPRNGLTVKAFYSREDFKKGKNGERLIDEGRWRMID